MIECRIPWIINDDLNHDLSPLHGRSCQWITHMSIGMGMGRALDSVDLTLREIINISYFSHLSARIWFEVYRRIHVYRTILSNEIWIEYSNDCPQQQIYIRMRLERQEWNEIQNEIFEQFIRWHETFARTVDSNQRSSWKAIYFVWQTKCFTVHTPTYHTTSDKWFPSKETHTQRKSSINQPNRAEYRSQRKIFNTAKSIESWATVTVIIILKSRRPKNNTHNLTF